MTRNRRRRGFAMLLVVAILMLFLSVLTMGFSQLSALLRAETHRVQKLQFDQGPAAAVAQGLALLETGFPATSPFACSVLIDTVQGTQTYALVFTLEAGNTWSVTASPASPDDNLLPIPIAFTAPKPPL
ncbi:MAG TPA: hypothetical protein VG713_06570 [Pirellulales bacterium]|nr:hypothetical protein [Pirellulales bacterium]